MLEAILGAGAIAGTSALLKLTNVEEKSGKENVEQQGKKSIVNGAGEKTTRVGRWMSQEEYNKMIASGKVQMSGDNKVHVANPANIQSFGKQAPKGSLYVECDVPSNTISKGGSEGWGKTKNNLGIISNQ